MLLTDQERTEGLREAVIPTSLRNLNGPTVFGVVRLLSVYTDETDESGCGVAEVLRLDTPVEWVGPRERVLVLLTPGSTAHLQVLGLATADDAKRFGVPAPCLSSAEDVLDWLSHHKPLPWDQDFTQRLADELTQVVTYLQEHPDSRAVRPLLFAMGEGTGGRLYEAIEDLIAAYPASDVVPVLRDALESDEDSTRYRALRLVRDFPDRSLLPLVRNLMTSDASDILSTATAALQSIVSPSDRHWLVECIQNATDDELAESYQEILSSIENGPEE